MGQATNVFLETHSELDEASTSDLRAVVATASNAPIRISIHHDLSDIESDWRAFEQHALGSEPAVLQGARVAGLERVVLLRGLRRAGITVVDWDVEQPLQQVVAASLGRAPRWSGGAEGQL